jgi:hypothetical protein
MHFIDFMARSNTGAFLQCRYQKRSDRICLLGSYGVPTTLLCARPFRSGSCSLGCCGSLTATRMITKIEDLYGYLRLIWKPERELRGFEFSDDMYVVLRSYCVVQYVLLSNTFCCRIRCVIEYVLLSNKFCRRHCHHHLKHYILLYLYLWLS